MRRRCAAALIVLTAAGVAGCGSEDFPNNPRPPSAVELSARIDDGGVTVAPNKIGAGIAVVTVSNQSSDDVSLDFSGPSRAATNEISSGGVGTLRLNLEQGKYSVEPSVDGIPAGKLDVGAERSSAQNDLLLP